MANTVESSIFRPEYGRNDDLLNLVGSADAEVVAVSDAEAGEIVWSDKKTEEFAKSCLERIMSKIGGLPIEDQHALLSKLSGMFGDEMWRLQMLRRDEDASQD